MIHTLHEFMLQAANATYWMAGVSLVAVMAFWFFLTGRDKN
jgi:hypothetical protein